MEKTSYKLLVLPEHSYLECYISDLQNLELLNSISSYSYYDKYRDLVYLEEDSDLIKFYKKYQEKYQEKPDFIYCYLESEVYQNIKSMIPFKKNNYYINLKIKKEN